MTDHTLSQKVDALVSMIRTLESAVQELKRGIVRLDHRLDHEALKRIEHGITLANLPYPQRVGSFYSPKT